MCKKNQSWARDNTAATTWPCFQAKKTVDYCIMSIFIVATPFRHWGLQICRIFCCLWSSITLSRCSVVAKLNRIVACPQPAHSRQSKRHGHLRPVLPEEPLQGGVHHLCGAVGLPGAPGELPLLGLGHCLPADGAALLRGGRVLHLPAGPHTGGGQGLRPAWRYNYDHLSYSIIKLNGGEIVQTMPVKIVDLDCACDVVLNI